MNKWTFIGSLLFACAFFVFTYNSGYGYDAVEYLVIGRSLNDGYSVFAFSPSKSPGIYLVTALFLKLFPEAGHLEISAFVTGLLLIILTATYLLVAASHGSVAAGLSAAFLALSACFMEMNFLETEGFVYFLSLPALPCLRNGLRRASAAWLLLAGFWIGAAAFFKTVALFYLLGATVFVFAWTRLQPSPARENAVRLAVALWVGAAVAILIPATFYFLRGELNDFLFWSFLFPLRLYPSDTVYLPKLLLKLSWFWVLLGSSLLLTLHPRVRAALSMSVYPGASLAMGVAALLPLMKNQASHYMFPAAGFLCIFMGIVWAAWAAVHTRASSRLTAGLVIALLLAAGSAALYRPSALKRLVTLRHYDREEAWALHLPLFAQSNDVMLCMSHPLPYWLARRYPAIPTVATHVHFEYLLHQNPRLLLDAVENPRLALVEFAPEYTRFRAPGLQNDPQAETVLRTFSEALALRFRPIEVPGSPYRFWVRR